MVVFIVSMKVFKIISGWMNLHEKIQNSENVTKESCCGGVTLNTGLPPFLVLGPKTFS